MMVPSPERLETHARAARLMATDAAFRETVVTNADGDSPMIVMDWDDTIRELFDAIARVGLPSNLVVPYGDGGIWLFNCLESQAHSKFTEEADLDAPLGELLREAMRRGQIAISPAADRLATIRLKLFREAS